MDHLESVDPPHTTPRCIPLIGMSTICVYPESVASAFEIGAKAGYDGIEVMVGVDPLSADVDYIRKMSDYHAIPVLSVHAPCLLMTQSTWGGPWEKLERSAEAALTLGADTVVVHPPFRWQIDYAKSFVSGIADLEQRYPTVKFAVENMYPLRVIGALTSQLYAPHWDPTSYNYQHLTLDFSHCSTAGVQAIDYVRSWGSRLAHVHLTDGTGKASDEHLFPGEGDQRAWDVLDEILDSGFDGNIVVEVNTRKYSSTVARQQDLTRLAADIRAHVLGPEQGAKSAENRLNRQCASRYSTCQDGQSGNRR